MLRASLTHSIFPLLRMVRRSYAATFLGVAGHFIALFSAVFAFSQSEIVTFDDASTTIDQAIGSDIIEISTRHLSDRFCSIDETAPPLQVFRFQHCQWLPVSLQHTIQDEDKLTIIYVHGNFMERDNARERVRIVDAYLRRQATESYRLILFSWPSEKERPIIRDAADNAKVAEMESLYVAGGLKQ